MIEKPLICSDAVAAIVCTHDGAYLLQHRDDISGIWYPDHWGCFGGAVDRGESHLDAIKRELKEELGLALTPTGPVFNMDYDIVGKGTFCRNYYELYLSEEEADQIQLGEGQGYAAFDAQTAMTELSMTPYDAFALFLHAERNRISVSHPDA